MVQLISVFGVHESEPKFPDPKASFSKFSIPWRNSIFLPFCCAHGIRMQIFGLVALLMFQWIEQQLPSLGIPGKCSHQTSSSVLGLKFQNPSCYILLLSVLAKVVFVSVSFSVDLDAVSLAQPIGVDLLLLKFCGRFFNCVRQE